MHQLIRAVPPESQVYQSLKLIRQIILMPKSFSDYQLNNHQRTNSEKPTLLAKKWYQFQNYLTQEEEHTNGAQVKDKKKEIILRSKENHHSCSMEYIHNITLLRLSVMLDKMLNSPMVVPSQSVQLVVELLMVH